MKITEYPKCPYCGTDVENVRTVPETITYKDTAAFAYPYRPTYQEFTYVTKVEYYAQPCGCFLQPAEVNGMTWKGEPDDDHPVRFGK